MDEHNDNEPQWQQTGGDVNPGAYGAILTRVGEDSQTIEIREIQPVRAYVGDSEAFEVGFPFWTREAHFDFADLNGSHPEDASALGYVGLVRLPDGSVHCPGDWGPMGVGTSRMATAEAYLAYGLMTDEGPCGWSYDVVPGTVRWMLGDVAGPEYLADEDAEFRRECTLGAGVFEGLTNLPEYGGYEDRVDLVGGCETLLDRIENDWPDEPMDWPEHGIELVVALYHAMMDCHGGQWSEEYSIGSFILARGLYDPNGNDIERDSPEYDLYLAACELLIPGSTEGEE